MFRAADLFLGCLHDAAQLLWIALVELIPRLLGTSVKSIKIPAALCPEIHNPTGYSHCTFVTIHFRFFAKLTFNLPVQNEHITEFTSRFWIIELTFRRMPIITE